MQSASDWEALLWSLMAMDNTERNRAEAVFAELKTQSDVTLTGLLDIVHSTRSDDVRGLAAVLLRRVLLRDAVSLWPEASEAVQTALKERLLTVLSAEENRSIRRKVCDTVGELASSILEDGQWDDLLPTLLQWMETPNVTLRETTLRVLEMIAIYLASMLESSDGDLQVQFERTVLQTLAKSLSDTEGRVAVNAVRALSMLLINMDSLEIQQPDLLHNTLALVLGALHRMLNTQRFDEVMETLEVLIEVTEPHAPYFKPLLREFVETMVQIADPTASQVPDGCRQLAMEFLVSIAENAAAACRKLPKNLFVNAVYPVTFRMMLELDDLETWSVTTCEDEEDTHEISNFDVGSEALERLVGAIGAKKSLPKCFALIQEYAARGDSWVHRHAALVGLCQILEILSQDELDEITKHLLTQANDPHPRVCCTAIDVIGQMSMDQGPHFQEAYHQQALTVLLHYLQDTEKPRLQAHAATALRQFIDMCAPEILTPYLENLLQQLFHVLQNAPLASSAHHVVREQTITALSSVATVAGQAFAQYYSAVMPLLHEILVSCLKESTTSGFSGAFTLGGITLECISLIGVAVGRGLFATDAVEIMKLMAEMQSTPAIVENEGIRTYLLQAWARFAKCLGSDFAPYLPIVMPTLLQAAMQQAEFEVDPTTMLRDDDETSSTTSSNDDIQIAQVNDKCLSIRTSILEEKATACQLLAGMVTDLEAAFFPYAEQVTQVLAPLMTDSVHSDIRTASISAMAALVRCVALANATNEQTIKQMVDFALGRLVHALTSEPELDLVMTIMQSMKHCIDHAQASHPHVVLNDAQLREVVQALLLVLADSFQRRAIKRAERSIAHGEEFEGEDGIVYEDVAVPTGDADSDDDESENVEQEVQFLMADCIGHLAKTHGAAFFPVFQGLVWEKIVELSAAHCLPEDRKLALYVLDDVLEHCGPPAMSQMETFVPLLVDVLQTSEGYPPLVQAAAYGLGVCGRLGGPLFAHHAPSTLQLLLDVVALPHAQESYMRNATDNAVSAIGLICEHHANVVDAATLFPKWLSMLPLRGDIEESVQVLQRLCRYVRERNEFVLGADGRHVALVVRVFAETMAHARSFTRGVGEDAFGELRQAIADALALLRASLPQDAMTQAWSTLTPTQQSALHALFT
ncbi:hypothetical protein Poli38472_007281 [Pythium oligandrum]|uniref:TOG domain-containing protein n=1 Tax=Pythium oligandrum TaxID=41045 RepID=A0A8K1C9G0_PYTOL|nr:hypothetical protein Poli38472_007281 [Pythium oligandrum]|eukprot:TMW59136.1 hypothetical protein Poli38472_007281 [Pythium oligandrum]